MRLRLQVLALSIVLAGTAAAEPRTNHRFHLWTGKLRQRVSPAMRQGVDAVGCYLAPKYNWRFQPKGQEQLGTAFLVERSGGRGLVLTNAHVVRDREGVFTQASSVVGAQVAFRLGSDGAPQTASVRRLVTGARHLDFALLEVDLPPALQRLEPVRLSRGLPDGARKVFSAGFPAFKTMQFARLATALGPGAAQLLQASSGLGLTPRSKSPVEAPKTVQVGRLKHGGRVDLSAWGSYQRPQLLANLPAFHGSSGSPVFDGRTGAVIGLLRGMEGYGSLVGHEGGRGPKKTLSWNTRIVPVQPILDWVGQSLRQGKLPADLQQRVGRLLDSSGN